MGRKALSTTASTSPWASASRPCISSRPRDRGLIEAVERNYRQVMDRYGRQPGGMFGADENIRPGKEDPARGPRPAPWSSSWPASSRCSRSPGTPVWADRAEEIAFNSLPASMTPDLKGLHYLTAAEPRLLRQQRRARFPEHGHARLVRSLRATAAASTTSAFGWPYLAEHLWLATADGGLAAAIYGPSAVRAKVGEGTEVGIAEDTAYPLRRPGPADGLLRPSGGLSPLPRGFPAGPKASSIVLNGHSGRRGPPGRTIRGPAADLAARRPRSAWVRRRRSRSSAGRPSAAPPRSAAARSGTP
ncbi:MAG: glycoside hydrolase family 127 protein [Candidatus Moduliflexus flocculans]|nr:glycoside hydrolase family 127 protein [Candidatus Moduliflexus flocculans]